MHHGEALRSVCSGEVDHAVTSGTFSLDPLTSDVGNNV
ncbi:hypothetical protein H4W80_010456 [Nonomuraea angiospora]|uniref:Uncharacterized protein n=1 Tax=Nonomuraea angiospora TaxID=46172 RepID=A0ABR9MI38_9ACTN|nr:hypothetical protein [Nonomuraea angiospora]